MYITKKVIIIIAVKNSLSCTNKVNDNRGIKIGFFGLSLHTNIQSYGKG